MTTQTYPAPHPHTTAASTARRTKLAIERQALLRFFENHRGSLLGPAIVEVVNNTPERDLGARDISGMFRFLKLLRAHESK